MLDIRKAGRWKFPTVRYTNFRRQSPNLGNCFKRWFYFNRYWNGKIWYFGIKHYQISLDFRLSWVDDMSFPGATKKDRKAVDDAVRITEK